MDHHRKLSAWLLVAASVTVITLITFGHGVMVLDAISETGLATTQEIVWLARQGQ